MFVFLKSLIWWGAQSYELITRLRVIDSANLMDPVPYSISWFLKHPSSSSPASLEAWCLLSALRCIAQLHSINLITQYRGETDIICFLSACWRLADDWTCQRRGQACLSSCVCAVDIAVCLLQQPLMILPSLWTGECRFLSNWNTFIEAWPWEMTETLHVFSDWNLGLPWRMAFGGKVRGQAYL